MSFLDLLDRIMRKPSDKERIQEAILDKYRSKATREILARINKRPRLKKKDYVPF